jgi:hypothetical protein
MKRSLQFIRNFYRVSGQLALTGGRFHPTCC